MCVRKVILTATCLLANAVANGSVRAQNLVWDEIYQSPHPVDSFTALTVDEDNPDVVVLGTEAGVVMRSRDRGITFDTYVVHPQVQYAGNVQNETVVQPTIQTNLSTQISWIPLTPYWRLAPVGVMDFLDPWEFIVGGQILIRAIPNRPRLSAWAGSVRASLLFNAVYPPRVQQDAVRALALCGPVAQQRLYVAMESGVYVEDGPSGTFLPIFGLTRDAVTAMRCAHIDGRNQILVGTQRGAFYSRDGFAFSLIQSTPANEGVRAIAISETGKAVISVEGQLYAATLAGANEQPFFHEAQAFADATMWMEFAEDGSLWVATADDGLHVAHGDSAPVRVTERGALWQIATTKNAQGEDRLIGYQRICISPTNCRDTDVLTSDDRGVTWRTTFRGQTRRNLRAIWAPKHSSGDVWLIAGHELWRAGTFDPEETAVHNHSAWARGRLARTPSLYVILARILERTRTRERDFADAFHALAQRNLLPINLEANFSFFLDNTRRDSRRELFMPYDRTRTSQVPYFVFFLQAVFALDGVPVAEEELGAEHVALERLQRILINSCENIWRERRLHLQRLAHGVETDMQAELLRERVEVLEAFLEPWLGEGFLTNG